MEEKISEAIKNAMEGAPERKFVESLDIAFTIKDVDLKNPNNRIQEEIRLPSGRGKELKIAMFAASDAAQKAKAAGIHVIDPSEIEELGKNKGNAKKLAKDLAYVASSSVLQSYFGLSSLNPEANENLEKGNRLFIDGLTKMNPDKTFYPNANFSMRMTYGSVGDYVPADAVHYDCVTTLDGVMEKYVPGDLEFDIPQKMIDLHKAKDYGPYADENGDLIINFIHNTDITGGNSGSPVINAKGHLIGTAFDGNWEAMSGDIAFEPELQRTISCDIRYVLFIIDKYAGASHLIEEMDLVY